MRISLVVAGFLALMSATSLDAADKKKKKPADTGIMKLEDKFTKLDANKDGKLSFDEFKELMTTMPKPKGKKEAGPDLAGIFTKLDENKNNFVNLIEFNKLPKEMPAAAMVPEKKKK